MGHVIPKTKALKHWLIFENFKFFHWNFEFFWDMNYVGTQKNAKRLALEEGREAAEIIISDS